MMTGNTPRTEGKVITNRSQNHNRDKRKNRSDRSSDRRETPPNIGKTLSKAVGNAATMTVELRKGGSTNQVDDLLGQSSTSYQSSKLPAVEEKGGSVSSSSSKSSVLFRLERLLFRLIKAERSKKSKYDIKSQSLDSEGTTTGITNYYSVMDDFNFGSSFTTSHGSSLYAYQSSSSSTSSCEFSSQYQKPRPPDEHEPPSPGKFKDKGINKVAKRCKGGDGGSQVLPGTGEYCGWLWVKRTQDVFETRQTKMPTAANTRKRLRKNRKRFGWGFILSFALRRRTKWKKYWTTLNADEIQFRRNEWDPIPAICLRISSCVVLPVSSSVKDRGLKMAFKIITNKSKRTVYMIASRRINEAQWWREMLAKIERPCDELTGAQNNLAYSDEDDGISINNLHDVYRKVQSREVGVDVSCFKERPVLSKDEQLNSLLIKQAELRATLRNKKKEVELIEGLLNKWQDGARDRAGDYQGGSEEGFGDSNLGNENSRISELAVYEKVQNEINLHESRDPEYDKQVHDGQDKIKTKKSDSTSSLNSSSDGLQELASSESSSSEKHDNNSSKLDSGISSEDVSTNKQRTKKKGEVGAAKKPIPINSSSDDDSPSISSSQKTSSANTPTASRSKYHSQRRTFTISCKI